MSKNQMQIQTAAIRITEENLTFIIRQAHGLPAQTGTDVIANKPIFGVKR